MILLWLKKRDFIKWLVNTAMVLGSLLAFTHLGELLTAQNAVADSDLKEYLIPNTPESVGVAVDMGTMFLVVCIMWTIFKSNFIVFRWCRRTEAKHKDSKPWKGMITVIQFIPIALVVLWMYDAGVLSEVQDDTTVRIASVIAIALIVFGFTPPGKKLRKRFKKEEGHGRTTNQDELVM